MTEKWWRGNTRGDFEQFLREAFAAGIDGAAFPECDGCGCQVYRLQAREGIGLKRHCVACGASHGICGTAFPDEPGRLGCACGKNQFELAVAFDAAGSPRIGVARRCLACGSMELAMAWSVPAGTSAAILATA